MASSRSHPKKEDNIEDFCKVIDKVKNSNAKGRNLSKKQKETQQKELKELLENLKNYPLPSNKKDFFLLNACKIACRHFLSYSYGIADIEYKKLNEELATAQAASAEITGITDKRITQ